MGLRLITAPVEYPVTLLELQKHCSAPETDFESILEMCRKAATDEAEQFTGRALIEQTWDLTLDAFPASGPIRVPKPPLIELVGIYYRDSAGNEQTFAATGYIVDADNNPAGQPARISLASGGSWPTPDTAANAVRIRFKAGYINDASPAVENVPYAIKAAILMVAATLFAHRETIVIGQTATMLPWGAEQLLRRYRVEKAMA
jgi:uncharacterized phiE125 gp8 family phage protein